MIYAYAVLDGDATAGDDLLGLDDRPVETRASGKLAVALTRHDAGHRPAADAQSLWRHERVVEALMERHALLPARFGTTFADDARLNAALTLHHDALAEGLDRVRGCVELGVRVLGEPPAVAEAPNALGASTEVSGRAYMLALAEQDRRRREAEGQAAAVSAAVHERLAAIARESTSRPLLTPELVLSAAYLVERGRVGEFRQRVAELSAEHPQVRVLCTGPWPPYHFVPSIDAAAAAAEARP